MKLDKTLKIVEIVILGFGALMALLALLEYKEQSKIAVLNRLDEVDQKLIQMQFEHSDAASIFSDLDRNLDQRVQADQFLNLAIGCNPTDTKCAKELGGIPNWKTIPELECAIWHGPTFKRTSNRKLREGVLVAESILYLVARAHERKKEIGDKEYQNWTAYIKDYGHHPLLLSAIRNGMTHGYLSVEFSVELKDLLLKESDRASKMIERIYPEFKKEVPRSLEGTQGCHL